MIYKCSECRKDIGLIGTKDGRTHDREGNPVKFYCHNSGRVATLLIPLRRD